MRSGKSKVNKFFGFPGANTGPERRPPGSSISGRVLGVRLMLDFDKSAAGG